MGKFFLCFQNMAAATTTFQKRPFFTGSPSFFFFLIFAFWAIYGTTQVLYLLLTQELLLVVLGGDYVGCQKQNLGWPHARQKHCERCWGLNLGWQYSRHCTISPFPTGSPFKSIQGWTWWIQEYRRMKQRSVGFEVRRIELKYLYHL